jgi:thioredoxin 1
MNRRRLLLAIMIGSALSLAGHASAAEYRPFVEKDFVAAQKADAAILIDVAADWCPTCKAQAPVLERLGAEPAFAKLIVFRLDYDKQTNAWRKLRVRQQSTLIAFKGRKETARSVGDTNVDSLRRLLQSAVR